MPAYLADIRRTFGLWRLIVYMAWSDVRARYKRSVLGPLWITLGTAVSVVVFSFVWAELLHMDRATFVPILTTGLILWQYISACINESAAAFTRQAGVIRNLDLPLSMHPAQLILRHMFNFAHNFPLIIAVALVMGVPLGWGTLMVVPGFILVTANLLWIALLIGMLGARFRDLEYMISMIMPLLMFLSPVLYRPNALPFSGKFIWLNPISSLIEVIRYPLLGQPTPLFVYLINVAMLVFGGSVTLVLFNRRAKRIAFWV